MKASATQRTSPHATRILTRPACKNPTCRRGLAEEVYVLAGSGRIKLDEEVVDLQSLDAIRVAPDVTRAFEAGPSGLDLLAFGPRCDGDSEVLMGWWAD